MIEFINDSQNIEMVDLHVLQEHPRNPRKGQVSVIQESMKQNGFYGVILAQKSTKYILVGNHRYKALRAEDQAQAPVVDRDWETET